MVAAALLLLVMATSLGWLLYRAREAPEASVAVLPFVQVGAGDTAFFAEGLTDEVINTLSRAPGLRVSAGRWREKARRPRIVLRRGLIRG